MKSLPQILTLSSLILVSAAWSACDEPVVPNLPNPDLAGEAEMLRAQSEVKRYIALQEEFLSCVQHNIRKHNRAVDLLHDVANKYNSSTRRFKTRVQSQNMITELALVDLTRF